jgi:holin-like protein
VIAGLLVLLGCQLAGEFLVRLLAVPLPGPVVGMVILLVVLQVREPGRDSGVVRVAEGLLRHLQLLFVPAGVGVVQYLSLLGASVVPLVLGLTLSWAVALLVTAATVAALLRVPGLRGRAGGTPGRAAR